MAEYYNKEYPKLPRNGDQLKRKFRSLRDRPKPTGSTTVPEEVQRAKVLDKLIRKSSATKELNRDTDSDDHSSSSSDGGNSQTSNPESFSSSSVSLAASVLREDEPNDQTTVNMYFEIIV